MQLLELFLCYLQIGLFSIGGGHAAIPVVQKIIVEQKGWLTMQEFVDEITISEMTPGPIGINSATFIGTKLGGTWGGIVATVGCVLPSFIIVILLAILMKKYKKLTPVGAALYGMKPVTSGLIASAGLSIILLAFLGVSTLTLTGITVDYLAIAIAAIGFIVLRKTKINSIFVIFGSGAAYLVCDLLLGLL